MPKKSCKNALAISKSEKTFLKKRSKFKGAKYLIYDLIQRVNKVLKKTKVAPPQYFCKYFQT